MSDVNWKDILIGKESGLGAGLRNGVSLGWSDEALGGILGLKDFAAEYLKKGYPAEGLMDSYKQYYIKNRDEQREMDHQIASESPIGYAAGNMIGSVATPGNSIKSLAGIGAASAIGNSESSTIDGNVADGLVGGVAGGALGGITHGVSKYFSRPQLGAGNTLVVPKPIAQPIVTKEVVAGPIDKMLEGVPEMQPKGALELHAYGEAGPAVMSNAEKIAAFRKKQAAGLNVANKSDAIVDQMYGIKPNESNPSSWENVYQSQVDDITVPVENRGLFGVEERPYPKFPMSQEDKLLVGDWSFPPQSRVPQLGDIYKDAAPQMSLVETPKSASGFPQLGSMSSAAPAPVMEAAAPAIASPVSSVVRSPQLGDYNPFAKAGIAEINKEEN